MEDAIYFKKKHWIPCDKYWETIFLNIKVRWGKKKNKEKVWVQMFFIFILSYELISNDFDVVSSLIFKDNGNLPCIVF